MTTHADLAQKRPTDLYDLMFLDDDELIYTEAQRSYLQYLAERHDYMSIAEAAVDLRVDLPLTWTTASILINRLSWK